MALSLVKAILFDAFGTLCEICNKRNPYKPIIKAWSSGIAAAYQTLMTKDIAAGALALEAGCSPALAQQIEVGIQAETTSMRLYPEVPAILNAIKKCGLKWAIMSNLATPYAEPLLKLLPFAPDACAWSFAVGYRKPEAGIYRHACAWSFAVNDRKPEAGIYRHACAWSFAVGYRITAMPALCSVSHLRMC